MENSSEFSLAIDFGIDEQAREGITCDTAQRRDAGRDQPVRARKSWPKCRRCGPSPASNPTLRHYLEPQYRVVCDFIFSDAEARSDMVKSSRTSLAPGAPRGIGHRQHPSLQATAAALRILLAGGRPDDEDPGAGARSRTQANQDRLSLGDRARRPAVGSTDGRLRLRARAWRRACHHAVGRI